VLPEQLHGAWSSEYFFAYGLELPSQLPKVISAGDKKRLYVLLNNELPVSKIALTGNTVVPPCDMVDVWVITCSLCLILRLL